MPTTLSAIEAVWLALVTFDLAVWLPNLAAALLDYHASGQRGMAAFVIFWRLVGVYALSLLLLVGVVAAFTPEPDRSGNPAVTLALFLFPIGLGIAGVWERVLRKRLRGQRG